MGKERKSEKCRRSLKRIQRKDECRNQETRKNKYDREELPEKFITKMLYRWNNGKFEEENLKKLERNWRR